MTSSLQLSVRQLSSSRITWTVFGSLIGLYVFGRLTKSWWKPHLRALRDKVSRRLKERDENFKRIRLYAETLPSARAEFITSLEYLQLKEELQIGRITCEEALKAYQQKALKAQEITNCICMFNEEAIELARELDKLLEEPGPLPPLFGIPVSIKESIKIKGMDCTCGHAQDLFKPAEAHSVEVEQLIRLGAVPFVHTNIPQSLCSFGCSNPVYGTTNHPMSPSRVPGGSSGGEAALIASGGSLFGIGSDIGGSIRIPSTYCGIAGFKPSVLRMSHTYNLGAVPGRSMVHANNGPMSSDLEACIDYCRTIWSDPILYDNDPYLAPVKWNEDDFSSHRPLTIGYYTTDNYIHPVPAYQRAVKESIQILEQLGHTCVPFEIPNSEMCFPLLAACVSADGGIFLNKKLDQDLTDPNCDYGFVIRRLTPKMRQILSHLVPVEKLKNLLRSAPVTASDVREVNADTRKYRKEFVEKMRKEEIDVIVCPVMSMYPPEHAIAPKLMPACNYTALYNLLDFAAGTVKVTNVSQDDEEKLGNYEVNDLVDRTIKQQSKNFVGFPIGIQVAAPPYKEEMVFRVLKMLSKTESF